MSNAQTFNLANHAINNMVTQSPLIINAAYAQAVTAISKNIYHHQSPGYNTLHNNAHHSKK